jgi:hypothetical protein
VECGEDRLADSVYSQASDGSTALTIAVHNDRLLVCQVLVAADPEQAVHVREDGRGGRVGCLLLIGWLWNSTCCKRLTQTDEMKWCYL